MRPARGADAIVVHHRILWNGVLLVVKGSHRRCLETLLL
jgi:putative NIF3 family GTP cyclohydrolase 1 type 2